MKNQGRVIKPVLILYKLPNDTTWNSLNKLTMGLTNHEHSYLNKEHSSALLTFNSFDEKDTAEEKIRNTLKNIKILPIDSLRVKDCVEKKKYTAYTYLPGAALKDIEKMLQERPYRDITI